MWLSGSVKSKATIERDDNEPNRFIIIAIE